MKPSNRLRLGLVGLLGGLLAMQVPLSPGEAQVAQPRPFATLPSAHSVQGLAFDCIQVWYRSSNGLDFRPAPEDDRDAVCARHIRSFKSELEEATRLVSRKMLFCDRKAGIVDSMRVAARGAEAANCPISMNQLADSIRTVENGSCLNSVVPRYTP